MDLSLDGSEEVEIKDFGAVEIHKKVQAIIRKTDGSEKEINLELQINTENEVEYIANGGILQRVVRGRL
jgi:aconitate hydratase